MENSNIASWGDVYGFYQNVGFGMLVLVLPIVVWTLISTGILALVAVALRVRVAIGVATLFIASFSMVGGVAGAIAGATLESIVGASLAAILGLVSSMLAYLFGKETLRVWRPVIPLAIIALLTSTLIGLVVGGSRRSQLIYEQRVAERKKSEFDNIYAPSERERQIAYYRKCIADRTALEAANECQRVDGAEPE